MKLDNVFKIIVTSVHSILEILYTFILYIRMKYIHNRSLTLKIKSMQRLVVSEFVIKVNLK